MTFRKSLAAKGVVVAGSLASLAGKAFRLGHMGNVEVAELRRAIALIGETLGEQVVGLNVTAALAVFDAQSRQ
ncbi:MAG: hypothetical protein DDT34_01602 [Firmicutes bacterium]|nr:hypothetical protein [Bacillota bacterium]